MNIPNAPLKGIFFVHLLFTTWAMQVNWLPNAYMLYNALFLILILWGIHHKDSEEPVFMALVIDFASLLLDSIIIGIHYPRGHASDSFKFSAGMCILNLLLRPVSCIILLRLFNSRGGRYSDFGIPNFGVPGRGQYDDIDQTTTTTQSVPKTSIDTGSPSHPYIGDTTLPPPYTSPQ